MKKNNRNIEETKAIPSLRGSGNFYNENQHTKTIEPIIPKRPAKKANYAIFLVTTVVICVLAAVFIFSMIYNSIAEGAATNNGNGSSFNQNPTQTQPETNNPPTYVEPALPPTDNVDLRAGIIQAINLDSRRLDIFLFETGTLELFFAANSTEMLNRFGGAIVLSQLNVGDVVEIQHTNATLDSIRISPQTVAYRNLSNVVVDLQASQILIGGRRYDFDANAVALYQGQRVDITTIQQHDILTIYTFDGKIASVNIHYGTAQVNVPAEHIIVNGIIEISNTHRSNLFATDMEFFIPEGQHRIMVMGSNIQTFEHIINLERGEIYELNLDNVILLTSDITITTNQNATITINGQTFSPGEAFTLDFGDYEVTISAQGYYTQSFEISITEPTHEFEFNLEPVIATRELFIFTNPTGARIYLDGVLMGESPIMLNVEFRYYNITLAKEGYIGGTFNIGITENTPNQTFNLFADPNFIVNPPF